MGGVVPDEGLFPEEKGLKKVKPQSEKEVALNNMIADRAERKKRKAEEMTAHGVHDGDDDAVPAASASEAEKQRKEAEALREKAKAAARAAQARMWENETPEEKFGHLHSSMMLKKVRETFAARHLDRLPDLRSINQDCTTATAESIWGCDDMPAGT
jgi:hypothetical protein